MKDWVEFEEAPMDGSIIIASDGDRKVAYIFYKFCDGDLEGAWVTAKSEHPIQWLPRWWTTVPTAN